MTHSSHYDRSQIERWLREDLGHHDVTNDVPGETTGRLVATESGVAAGIDAAAAVFEYLDVGVTEHIEAGDRLEAGDAVLRVEGDASAVLRGERVAVNVAGHASGVATRTRRAVEAAREVSDEVRIAGTRKTTPGLRGVEKRAIAAAGGDTHRLDLSHMVMIKDNHVAELGMAAAVERFRERASFATKIEVEVERPADAPRAVEADADIVLLDNMSPEETARAVELVDGDALTEASGGITVEGVPEYAATGVDVISLGSLTHSAAALDLSFRTGRENG
ncbi:nicotinate-nucleotide diphosphorylase (carboxylating) [Halobacteriales archaeon QS_1_68_44]|nr:MAG: nicotinate-nucleotide diphosphorylase (carboxylating) [Halobacteriales archaeon QS_1_68_44]